MVNFDASDKPFQYNIPSKINKKSVHEQTKGQGLGVTKWKGVCCCLYIHKGSFCFNLYINIIYNN